MDVSARRRNFILGVLIALSQFFTMLGSSPANRSRSRKLSALVLRGRLWVPHAGRHPPCRQEPEAEGALTDQHS